MLLRSAVFPVSHHRRRSTIARRIVRICCDATASAAPLQVPLTAAIAVVAANFPNFRVSGIRLSRSLWIREVPKIETFSVEPAFSKQLPHQAPPSESILALHVPAPIGGDACKRSGPQPLATQREPSSQAHPLAQPEASTQSSCIMCFCGAPLQESLADGNGTNTPPSLDVLP